MKELIDRVAFRQRIHDNHRWIRASSEVKSEMTLTYIDNGMAKAGCSSCGKSFVYDVVMSDEGMHFCPFCGSFAEGVIAE